MFQADERAESSTTPNPLREELGMASGYGYGVSLEEGETDRWAEGAGPLGQGLRHWLRAWTPL